jgi:hypothetical protein
MCIDTIARLSNPGPDTEPFGSKATRWLSTLNSAQKLLTDWPHDLQASLADLCSIVMKYSSYNYSTDRSVLKFESPEEPRSLEENQVLGAFIHVLFLGSISSRERLTEYDISELLDMDPLIAFSKLKETDHLDKVCQAFEQGSKRRRLLITEKGYVGSASQTAEEGDIACVLPSCSAPVIVRKFQDEDSYKFVGECYLHGFMDAEVITLQIKGVLKEQFILA